MNDGIFDIFKNAILTIILYIFGFFVILFFVLFSEILWLNYKYSNLVDWQDKILNKNITYTIEVSNKFEGKTSYASTQNLKISVIDENNNKLISDQWLKIKETNINYKNNEVFWYKIDNIRLKSTVNHLGKTRYHLTSARIIDKNQHIFLNTPYNYKAGRDKAYYFILLFVLILLCLVLSICIFQYEQNHIKESFAFKMQTWFIKIFTLMMFLLFLFHILRMFLI